MKDFRDLHDLEYLSEDTFNKLTRDVVEVKRMLASLLGRIKEGGAGVKTQP